MNNGNLNHKEIDERSNIRWTMVFYDSLFYLFCWFVVFVLHPSISQALPAATNLFYFLVGYILFFGFRFLLKSYKRILRYGKIHAFSRELLSGILGSAIYLSIGILLSKFFYVAEVPITTLGIFVTAYIVISILSRFVYLYLYRFAQGDSSLARFVRLVLKTFVLVDFDSDKLGATLTFSGKTETQQAPINELQNIAEQFSIHGQVVSITQINKGYINRTYRVETRSDSGHVHKYTMQRINTNVFPDVDVLMDNFKLTSSHLHDRLFLPGHRKKGSIQTIRPTRDGRSYFRDSSGCWRMLTYFEDVYSLDIPDSPETFYQAGISFGLFLKEMSDLDVNDFKEVIPNFHHTLSRYRDLEDAIKKDAKGRVKTVQPEIDFIRARADRFDIISTALEGGKIPTRICHNDCNLNNILFDNETHLPVAIIDLDTVMPSSPLYDFGDSMRIGTNTANDDEKDLSKVSCDLHLFRQYARGYLESCGDVLVPEELELLPYAALIVTAEDGIRFLMDYINGDTYYNIYYPGQNLDRSRTQLKLLSDMEKKFPEMKKILQEIYDELHLQVQIP